jgi:hypothetical protein
VAFGREGAVTFNVTMRPSNSGSRWFLGQKKKRKICETWPLARKAKIGFPVVVWHAFVRASFVQ